MAFDGKEVVYVYEKTPVSMLTAITVAEENASQSVGKRERSVDTDDESLLTKKK